jgi:Flp pilus assembly protein TadD
MMDAISGRLKLPALLLVAMLSLSACSGMPNGLPSLHAPVEDPIYGSLPSEKWLDKGKTYYRNGDYGLAEKSFRSAIEQDHNNAEAWLGLAASYDRLRRFDLAERAYQVVVKLVGNTPTVLNNLGYHHILKGEYAIARKKLAAAQKADPQNPYIQNNLTLIGDTGAPAAYRPAGG